MRAYELRYLVILALTLAAVYACGGGLQPSGGQDLAAGRSGAQGSDVTKAKPKPKPKPAIACKKGETVYAVALNSTVYWVVVKVGDVPVLGTHPVQGNLSVMDGEPLSSAQLKLDFDVAGSMTSLPLRDGRLREHIFVGADTAPVTFTLDGVTSEVADAAQTLPTAGTTVPLTLSGSLALAGRSIPVRVGVLLTGFDGGLEVAEGDGGVSLDLVADLGLGEHVDRLMALVGKRLDGSPLRLRFHLFLAKACR